MAPPAGSWYRRGTALIAAGRADFCATVPPAARLLFLAWVLYTAYVFLHAGALVHDEIDFLVLARSLSYADFVTRAPPALYGSLFWVGLKAAGGALPARAIVLVMMVLTPYLLKRALPDQRTRLLACALWLSFPIAWWTGKLIGPEIPAMFLVALALSWYVRGRLVASAFLLGLAAALKISAVPATLFFGVLYLLQPGPPWPARLRRLAAMGAVFLVALLIGFPSIVDGLRQLAAQQAPLPLPLPELLARSLLADRWEWDAVFSGGVLAFSMAAVPLVLAAVAALAGNWRVLAAALVSALGFLFLSARSASYYGWYWIAFFPILLHALVQLPPQAMAGRRRVASALLVLAVAGNVLLQLPLISDQVYQKAEQIRFLRNRAAIAACVDGVIAQRQPRSIYNLADFGLALHPAPGTKIYLGPGPEADAADLFLISTRMLVSKRLPTPGWTAPPLVATCDAVLVFSGK
jgi:hypothetical protein